MPFSVSNNLIRPVINFLDNHPNAGMLATTIPMLALDWRLALAAKTIESVARFIRSLDRPNPQAQSLLILSSAAAISLKVIPYTAPRNIELLLQMAAITGLMTECAARTLINEQEDPRAGLKMRAALAGLAGLSALSGGVKMKTAILLASIVAPGAYYASSIGLSLLRNLGRNFDLIDF